MNTSSGLKETPDELYLRNAFRDGAAVKQDVSMASLGEPDIKLQARVRHLDDSQVWRLRESLREIGSLRPITVFRELSGQKLWLADGFHRHTAYRMENRQSIPCYLIEGGYREALRFATMCNRENCLGRTKEDDKKAAFMLFADEEWFGKSNSIIAENIGVSDSAVHRWRAEYCEEKGVDRPSHIETKKGYGLTRPEANSPKAISWKPKPRREGYHNEKREETPRRNHRAMGDFTVTLTAAEREVLERISKQILPYSPVNLRYATRWCIAQCDLK